MWTDDNIKIEEVKKILFLDFDGVMVTDRHQEYLVATNSPLRNPKSVRSVYDMQAARNRRIDIVAYECK